MGKTLCLTIYTCRVSKNVRILTNRLIGGFISDPLVTKPSGKSTVFNYCFIM